MDTMDATPVDDQEESNVAMETSSSQNNKNTTDLPATTISPEWQFNVHLDKIGQALTDEDLQRMKLFCSGGLIGRAALNKATSAGLFFRSLRDMEFLSCNNLLHLQAMLWHIGRKDLHRDMVEFARSCRKLPLHFFSPNEKPVNGCKYVKFHIEGSEANRQEVEHIREVVASLLCIPIEYVALTGVEPSNSIVITFMVPDEVVKVLFDLSPEDRSIFKSAKVDYIFVDQNEIPIVGEKIQKPTTVSEMDNITKVLRERQQLKYDVDRLQVLLLERSEDLRQARANEECIKWSRDQAMIAFFTLLYLHRPATRIIDSLVSKSALVYFKYCLQQFQAKFPEEMDTIEILLEAKELVACKAERNVWQQHIESLRLLIEMKTNEDKTLNEMQIIQAQNMYHVSKPPRLLLNGQYIRQISRTVEIGVISGTMVQQSYTFLDIQVLAAAEKVSKMINCEQRKLLFQHFNVDKSEEAQFLERTETFLFRLFQMKPRKKPLLEFVVETIRLLDDRQLDEKVYNIVVGVQEACDQHTKDQQSLRQTSQTQQVRFVEGKQKRPVSSDVLRRLQDDPEKLQECLRMLQDLADNVDI